MEYSLYHHLLSFFYVKIAAGVFIIVLLFTFQAVDRQHMKLEEQKDENVEVTQELRLTRYKQAFFSFFYSTDKSILKLKQKHITVWAYMFMCGAVNGRMHEYLYCKA